MDGVSTSGLGAVAAGILKSEPAQNMIGRFMRKVWKKIKLKNVMCIIINDVDRQSLAFDFPDEKYQYLDVEKVYLSLLSDGEISRLRDLKKVSSRSWVMSVKQPCKKILNNVREAWRDEKVILCLSNCELAKELHVPRRNMVVYVQDDEYHQTLLEKVPEDTAPYLGEMRKKNKRVEYCGYKSNKQLVQFLEDKFRS